MSFRKPTFQDGVFIKVNDLNRIVEFVEKLQSAFNATFNPGVLSGLHLTSPTPTTVGINPGVAIADNGSMMILDTEDVVTISKTASTLFNPSTVSYGVYLVQNGEEDAQVRPNLLGLPKTVAVRPTYDIVVSNTVPTAYTVRTQIGTVTSAHTAATITYKYAFDSLTFMGYDSISGKYHGPTLHLDGSVSLDDNSVTHEKLRVDPNFPSATLTWGQGAVAGENIRQASIWGKHIMPATITGDKLASATIPGSTIAPATITSINLSPSIIIPQPTAANLPISFPYMVSSTFFTYSTLMTSVSTGLPTPNTGSGYTNSYYPKRSQLNATAALWTHSAAHTNFVTSVYGKWAEPFNMALVDSTRQEYQNPYIGGKLPSTGGAPAWIGLGIVNPYGNSSGVSSSSYCAYLKMTNFLQSLGYPEEVSLDLTIPYAYAETPTTTADAGVFRLTSPILIAPNGYIWESVTSSLMIPESLGIQWRYGTSLGVSVIRGPGLYQSFNPNTAAPNSVVPPALAAHNATIRLETRFYIQNVGNSGYDFKNYYVNDHGYTFGLHARLRRIRRASSSTLDVPVIYWAAGGNYSYTVIPDPLKFLIAPYGDLGNVGIWRPLHEGTML